MQCPFYVSIFTLPLKLNNFALKDEFWCLSRTSLWWTWLVQKISLLLLVKLFYYGQMYVRFVDKCCTNIFCELLWGACDDIHDIQLNAYLRICDWTFIWLILKNKQIDETVYITFSVYLERLWYRSAFLHWSYLQGHPLTHHRHLKRKTENHYW